MNSVFCDRNLCVKRSGKEALFSFHAFLLPDFCVTSFINPADVYAILFQNLSKRLQNYRLQQIGSESQRFYNQNILIFINGKSGQQIRVSEDNPAAGSVNDMTAVIPGVPDALFQENWRDILCLFPGQYADSDFRAGVDKAISQKKTVKIADGKNIPILKIPIDRSNLVIIDPETSCLQNAALTFSESGGGRYGQIFRRRSVRTDSCKYRSHLIDSSSFFYNCSNFIISIRRKESNENFDKHSFLCQNRISRRNKPLKRR